MDRIDPIGSWRDDFRMSILASTVTNLAIGIHGKKGTKPSNPAEFMPDWMGELEETNKKQTPQEMKMILLALAKNQSKKVISQAKKKPLKPKDNG